MAQSVKLSNGNYIDAEAVYDANIGALQTDLNNRFWLGNAISQVGFQDAGSAGYFQIIMYIKESARTGVLENIKCINFQALPTGFELYTQAVGSSDWVPVIRTGNTLKS